MAVALICSEIPANAQIQNVFLGVSGPTGPVQVNSPFTYTLNLTNFTATTFANVYVTNSLPASVQILNATNSLGTVSTNGTTVTFLIPIFALQVAQMTLTLQSTSAGFVTNRITVAIPQVFTNVIATNIVTRITNAPSIRSDLAVSFTNAPQSIIINDSVDYGLLVANRGTNSASGVVLSNSFSTGVTKIRVSPTNQTFTTSGNTMVFNLGTLTNGASRSLNIALQPTNAGTLTITASVTATNVTDTNPSNNTATAKITVGDFLSGDLVASNISLMVYNPQTGLMQQTIRLSNIGTNSAPSARVMVTGLTNALYNAVGTNDGNPFVVYGANLDPGGSVDMVLEYFVPARSPIPVDNTNYLARAVPAVNLAATSDTSSSFAITNITVLPSGNVLIEFPSTPGRSYTILYSDSASITNVAQPPIIAPADRVQWIDDGPPKTISHPTNATSRFYRVLLNP